MLSTTNATILLSIACLAWPLAQAGSGQSRPPAVTAERLNALTAQLRDAKDPAARARAADRLGQLGSRQATPPLIAALDDPDVSVQAAAAGALGQLRDPAAVAPLVKALGESPDTRVRWKASFALGLVQDRRAVDPLVRALKDPDLDVRMSSA
ncbi:MAG: HEAT repeat domain-containing protein, partial [Acidobacteria bacterium]|nr:HEAT repeat domain-containing protein [Acidobacteriota bacterium]